MNLDDWDDDDLDDALWRGIWDDMMLRLAEGVDARILGLPAEYQRMEDRRYIDSVVGPQTYDE